jgi:hypothetical protein
VFYSVGQNRLAIKHYGAIPGGSRYRAEALLEGGWARFKAGDHARALKNLRALGTARASLPEARLLEAVVQYKSCRYRRSLTLARAARASFKALRAELLALRGRYKDPIDFHDLALKLRDGAAQKLKLTGGARRLARAALSAPGLDKRVAYIKELSREIVMLQSSRPAWKAQAIAGVVLQDLTLHKSLAQHEAGSLARMQIQRAASQLQRLIKQLEQVIVEAGAGLKRGAAPAACDRLGRGGR